MNKKWYIFGATGWILASAHWLMYKFPEHATTWLILYCAVFPSVIILVWIASKVKKWKQMWRLVLPYVLVNMEIGIGLSKKELKRRLKLIDEMPTKRNPRGELREKIIRVVQKIYNYQNIEVEIY